MCFVTPTWALSSYLACLWFRTLSETILIICGESLFLDSHPNHIENAFSFRFAVVVDCGPGSGPTQWNQRTQTEVCSVPAGRPDSEDQLQKLDNYFDSACPGRQQLLFRRAFWSRSVKPGIQAQRFRTSWELWLVSRSVS